jgi:oligogalacturonide lyase
MPSAPIVDVSNTCERFRDPVTGRTVTRFTAGGIDVSPYFNNHAFTPDGAWCFFLRCAGDKRWVMACEVATGRLRRLAGPFPAVAHGGAIWTTLNAIPGAEAVTFVHDNAVWRADLWGARAERIADLPASGTSYGDSDVSADGRWHVVGGIEMSPEALEAGRNVGWPPDAYYQQYGITTLLSRVNLQTGMVEELWREAAVVDHISVNPLDPDLILYCHEGAIPYQYGRMFLRRVGEDAVRPVRDQRTGRVYVTHERWFADGRRIAYHGQYRGTPGQQPPPAPLHYVGIFDIDRDLPVEYLFADPAKAAWHCTPSPDGTCFAMDHMSGLFGIERLTPDPATGLCHAELLTSVASDLEPLDYAQFREQDPCWSPDGRSILFRATEQGSVSIYLVEISG